MSNREIRELKDLANKGNIIAQNDLAARFATGDGVVKDLKAAVHWYKKAAAQESHNAIFNLAIMHILGEGVGKNLREAVHMLYEAAELGSSDAHFVLGQAYCDGNLELDVNYLKAIEHFLEAARLGASKGIRAIGNLLAEKKVDIDSLAMIMRNFRL